MSVLGRRNLKSFVIRIKKLQQVIDGSNENQCLFGGAMAEKTSTSACVTRLMVASTLFAAAAAPAAAEQDNQQARAIQLIVNTADRICITAKTSGGVTSATTKASVDGALTGLARGLAKLGISVAAEYATSNYNGPLEKDVVAASIESDSCKEHVFDALLSRLMPNSQTGREPGNSTNVERTLGSHAGFPPAPTVEADAYLMQRTVEAQRRSLLKAADQLHVPIDPLEWKRADQEYTDGVRFMADGDYQSADNLLVKAKADLFDLQSRQTEQQMERARQDTSSNSGAATH